MKITSTVLYLFTWLCTYGQHYYNVNQTQINQTQIVNSGPSSSSLIYAVNTFANMFYDTKREKMAMEEAQAKLSMLKQSYNCYEAYPESIITGWHEVIVTDNLRFCRGAKVYVEDNKITEFVIDNCIRLSFTAPGKIKNAKTIVTINKFNGELFEMADVYFVYDIDGPSSATPPAYPGYVSFWTRSSKLVNRKIRVDQLYYDGVQLTFDSKPDCGSKGTVSLQLTPGRYSYRIYKSGNDLDGSFEIKSDQCLLQELE